MELVMGLLAIASGLYLAYCAGADEQDRAKWKAAQVARQYEAAVGESRQRHPSDVPPAFNVPIVESVKGGPW